MRDLQDDQLFHFEKQEEAERKAGDEKTLSEMQDAHVAQGS